MSWLEKTLTNVVMVTNGRSSGDYQRLMFVDKAMFGRVNDIKL